MARPMEHQAALLLGSLGCNEPHIGSGDGFANRLSIGHVVLLPFDVGLHIGRRHQTHRMTKSLELTRPIVRRGASLDANQAWWQLLKESQHRPPLQLTTGDHLAGSVNAVNPEN